MNKTKRLEGVVRVTGYLKFPGNLKINLSDLFALLTAIGSVGST